MRTCTISTTSAVGADLADTSTDESAAEASLGSRVFWQGSSAGEPMEP